MLSNSREQLLRLSPPDFGQDEQVDWPAMEAAWNIPFPSDYKWFLKHYGPGSFNDSLYVIALAGPDQAQVTAATAELAGSLASLAEHDVESPPYPAYPARPGLVRWGTNFTADDAHWLVDGPDPDSWPIVVWDRGMCEWITRPPGMIELLLQILTAPEGERAMSMMSSVPGRPVRFVNRHLENTLKDPWPDLANE